MGISTPAIHQLLTEVDAHGGIVVGACRRAVLRRVCHGSYHSRPRGAGRAPRFVSFRDRWRAFVEGRDPHSRGYENLKEELDTLRGDKRREIAERIRVAREFGDIAENAEYDDAKNEQAMLEHKIAQFEERLLTPA